MKRFVFFVVVFFCGSLLVFSVPKGALAQSGEEKIHEMEEVVVTAGRVEEKKEDVTTNITVVTEGEIKQSSARHLGELLSEEGFMIIEYPNSLVSVGIRGFRTETMGNDLNSRVLVLIDGRRAGTGNLAEISLDNVSRVEIIRGPGAVQYGSSAMGGVINVITKRGHDEPSVYAEGTLGSWNYEKTAVGASGEIKNFDFSFSGSTESQGDYDTAKGISYHNTGFDSKDRFSIDAGWTFMPKNRIGVTYTFYEGEGIGSPNYLSQNDLDDYVDHSIKSVDLSYAGGTPGDLLGWSLRYFNTERDYNNFDGNTHTYEQDTDQQGGEAQLTVNVGHTQVTGGVDWVEYKVDDTYSTGKNIYDNPAAFLLAKIKLLDEKLILSAGTRYDEYEIEADDGRSVSDSSWTPSVGVAYKIIKGLNVRANYAEAFRMPTADELFMYNDYSAWGFGIWSGNPNLKPEKSKTYEMGVDFSRGSCSSGLTYFHTEFKDKISYAYDAVAGVTRYENIKGATIAGIEGTFNIDIGEIFDWNWELKPYASFTYLTKYWDDQNNVNLSYNPEWTASYGVKLSKPKIGFDSKLNFAFFSEQDITDYEGTGDKTLAAYTVADLTVSKELFSFDRFGRVVLKGDVSNLFNKDYAVVQGYPSPGRTFYVGLKYEY
jgi:vitamin B12 transporter